MWKALILLAGCAGLTIPATAQISAEDAIGMCRSQVQVDAGNVLNTQTVEFRQTGVTLNQGAGYRVEGTFAAAGQPGTHTFACSVDRNRGDLHWVRIDSRPAPSRVAGGRVTYSDADVANICRDAVQSRVFNSGYVWTRFHSMDVENGPGVLGSVSGVAVGQTAGHENQFRYSCEVDRTTGQIASVAVDGH